MRMGAEGRVRGEAVRALAGGRANARPSAVTRRTEATSLPDARPMCEAKVRADTWAAARRASRIGRCRNHVALTAASAARSPETLPRAVCA